MRLIHRADLDTLALLPFESLEAHYLFYPISNVKSDEAVFIRLCVWLFSLSLLKIFKIFSFCLDVYLSLSNSLKNWSLKRLEVRIFNMCCSCI